MTDRLLLHYVNLTHQTCSHLGRFLGTETILLNLRLYGHAVYLHRIIFNFILFAESWIAISLQISDGSV